MPEVSYTVIVTKDGGDLSGNLLKYELQDMIKPPTKSIESLDELKEKFEFGTVTPDGNCLFTSLSKLLNNGKDAATTRREIFLYYKDFEKIKFIFEYNKFKDSLEGKMVRLLSFPDFDNKVVHQIAMEEDKIFGNDSDIVAASLLYKVNINVYVYNETKEIFELSTTGSSKFKKIINLELNGNHYQYLTPKDSTVNSSETKSNETKPNETKPNETKPQVTKVEVNHQETSADVNAQETKTPQVLNEVNTVDSQGSIKEEFSIKNIKEVSNQNNKREQQTKKRKAQTNLAPEDINGHFSIPKTKTGPEDINGHFSIPKGGKKRTTKRLRSSLY
jgi:hypothetical protein